MENFDDNNVNSEERITRFIFDPKYFNSDTRNISPQAFKPAPPKPPERPVLQTSVYRTQDLPDREIWEIGYEFVAKGRPVYRPVLARGDIRAKEVFERDLKIVPNPIPHFLHADIVNWLENPESRRLLQYSLLSQQASLVLKD